MAVYSSGWPLSKHFKRVGRWRLDSKSDQFEFECVAPTAAGIYAFSIQGNICYIGSSNNLKKRLNSYKRRVNEFDRRTTESASLVLLDEQAEKKEIVERLVRKEIRAALRAGSEIQIDIFSPPKDVRFATDFQGMTIDLVAGLEMGLIRQLGPPWNIRGRQDGSEVPI